MAKNSICELVASTESECKAVLRKTLRASSLRSCFLESAVSTISSYWGQYKNVRISGGNMEQGRTFIFTATRMVSQGSNITEMADYPLNIKANINATTFEIGYDHILKNECENECEKVYEILKEELPNKFPGLISFIPFMGGEKDKNSELAISPNGEVLVGVLGEDWYQAHEKRFLLSPVGPLVWKTLTPRSKGFWQLLSKIHRDWIDHNNLQKFLKYAGIKNNGAWDNDTLAQIVRLKLTK